MRHLWAVVARGRGALIYTAFCLVLLLLFRERAWQHVSTLNGDEWQPIQGFLRSNRTGDEPVCFLPAWTSGHATDLHKFRGIDVIESPSDAWEAGAEPEPGFWVVAQFDVFDPDTVPRDLYPHRRHVTIGGADVHVFRRAPFDLPETFALKVHEATCTLQGPRSERVELIWSRNGYIMPRSYPRRERFGYLGCYATESHFSGRTHYGIWFHPPPPGHSLSITWPSVKLQPWLAVSGGLRDQIASRSGSDINLAVLLEGKTLRTLVFPSKRGWKTFAVELGSTGGQGRLGFKVWTKNNNSRHFVFDAELERTRPLEAEDAAEGARLRSQRPAALRNRGDGGAIDEGVGTPAVAEPSNVTGESRSGPGREAPRSEEEERKGE